MKRFYQYAFLALVIFVSGCHSREEDDFTTGTWSNRYEGDASLAGVIVQQFPDNLQTAVLYEGRHPAMILYVFEDGKVNQVGFTPDGEVREDFWWEIEPDSYIWDQIDRSFSGR